MAANSKIEWRHDTVNFWWGCTQVSPACDHCYAKEITERFKIVKWNGPPVWMGNALAHMAACNNRAAKRGHRFVFINSMSDTFDNQATEQWRADLFAAVEKAPNVTALILTKRVGNVMGMLKYAALRWPPNAWLGISVVNQEEADRDIPKLLEAKEALGIPRMFLSIEPMLGLINLKRLTVDGGNADALTGGGFHYVGIDWVICGGESGREARPMHPDWARALRDQCATAGVPFFMKQMTKRADIPADLMIRERPHANA